MLRARGTGNVTTQVWTIFRSDRTADFGTYHSEKLKVTLDCEKMQFGSGAGTYYSAFGGIVHQFRAAEFPLMPVPPKSLQDIMATFLCSDGKKPSRALPVYDPSRDAEQRLLQYDREKKPAMPAPTDDQTDEPTAR